MQIKAQNWLNYLLEEFKKKQILFRQLYAAAGLLIVVSILLFLVVSVVHDKSLQQKKQHELALAEESKLSTAAVVSTPSMGGADTAEMEITMNETANLPLRGEKVLVFGWQEHPIYKDWRYHTGIDIRANSHQTIQAVFSGKVTNVYSDKHTGLTVVVESKDYKVYYGSLSAADVSEGSYIKKGENIGKTGTCREEPSEHLHLAIKKQDHYVDPGSLF